MSKEQKNAIVLTRFNGVGNRNQEHLRQTAKAYQLAEESDFYIWMNFVFDVGDNDADGLGRMMCYILGYLRHHPKVKHILVAKADVICFSNSLYEVFDNTLQCHDINIESAEFYEEERVSV